MKLFEMRINTKLTVENKVEKILVLYKAPENVNKYFDKKVFNIFVKKSPVFNSLFWENVDKYMKKFGFYYNPLYFMKLK